MVLAGLEQAPVFLLRQILLTQLLLVLAARFKTYLNQPGMTDQVQHSQPLLLLVVEVVLDTVEQQKMVGLVAVDVVRRGSQIRQEETEILLLQVPLKEVTVAQELPAKALEAAEVLLR